jgi:hypothetical protein
MDEMTSIKNHQITTVLFAIALAGLLLVSTSAVGNGHTGSWGSGSSGSGSGSSGSGSGSGSGSSGSGSDPSNNINSLQVSWLEHILMIY